MQHAFFTENLFDWESLRAGTLNPPLPPPGRVGLDESETAEVELETLLKGEPYVNNPGQWDYDW